MQGFPNYQLRFQFAKNIKYSLNFIPQIRHFVNSRSGGYAQRSSQASLEKTENSCYNKKQKIRKERKTKMKEYTVLQINCKKGLTISEIYKKIRETLTFDRPLFAIQNLKTDGIGKDCRKYYEELDLDRFAYKKVLEHLKQSPYYDPERDDRRMLSNADGCWEWGNPKKTEALSSEEFEKLILFCDGLRTSDISTVLIGFDEIRWNGAATGKGTYGYQKADLSYNLGKNYLSNSVMIGRTYESKQYTAYLSCENQFKTTDAFSDLASFLGETKDTLTYFAPENDEERAEWETAAKDARLRLQSAVSELKNLSLHIIGNNISKEDKKINIRKYITKFLCTDGWSIRKAFSDEWPTVVGKDKDDVSIHLSIISSHNGHQLQSIVYYRSPKFVFTEHIYELSCTDISEKDAENYFLNAQTIRNRLEELL